ncbi:transcriptional regulator, AraC family [Denitrovibrio acetiphilus DSM 12809]|uniref:Transcriptional regulator, AraC family n=1 Tax=Denitrovibrio acetiphilus (strain DSM 12809 / NBRC 114555 / N2460) TaxID=522772 RepID=D4H845_DENA2|nr:AraC family transcriptional regulator [Denitrovibrio acetiphilus]ADD68194.1 transcriptional regulator, AraC family [Denitrovibrio acetiphilus DSM 12809]
MNQHAEILNQFDLKEGVTQSLLESVRLFKVTHERPREPLLYDPCMCIIAQGHKVGYVGDRTFRYDPENYLVVSIATPFECCTFADENNPLLGIFIDIDMAMLHEVIHAMGSQVRTVSGGKLPQTVGPAVMDNEMFDAVSRLLNILRSETDVKVLGTGLVKEILYRALKGSQAHLLYALAGFDGSFANIAHVLRRIHINYNDKLDVNYLAEYANMSVSSFHRAFKEVTSEPPMQYLKKVRLTKAKDLIVNKRLKAYLAAQEVGYESVSQFSREFKRYFGESASEMIRSANLCVDE